MSAEAGGDSVLVKTARGAGWMLAWRMLNRGLGLVSLLVLVRLLSPDDFGLVALAFSFYGTLEGCMSIGVDRQLVRAQNPDRAFYDTAFTLDGLRALAMGAIVFAIAAPLADYMREPRLEAVVHVMALVAVTSGLTNIRTYDLGRSMDFRRIFLLQAGPRLLQLVAGIALAVLTRSYWALLIAILLSRLATIVMGYVMLPYRPRLTLVAWRRLVGVSFWSWVYSLVFTLRERMDSVVVGRVLGPTQVGIYTVSSEIAYLPTSELVGPICHACAPGFAASLRDSRHTEVADSFIRIMALTALVALPAGFGISLVAAPIVAIALGPAWSEAASLIAVLSVAFIATAFNSVCVALLQANLQLRQMAAVTAFSAALRVGTLIVVVPWFGLAGLSYGIGATILLDTLIVVVLAGRTAGVRAADLLTQGIRPVAGVLAMSAALWGTGLGWGPLPATAAAALPGLLGGVGLGTVAYVGVVALLWLLAGRPTGAETDLLTAADRLLRPALQRLGLRRRRDGLAT